MTGLWGVAQALVTSVGETHLAVGRPHFPGQARQHRA
jgi:hypothetical protein